MKKYGLLTLAIAFGLLSISLPITIRSTNAQNTTRDFVPPSVFQAAGKDVASIQSSVDAFRAALGNPNNGNGGPMDTGRREINWDGVGGADTTTTVPVTPFNVFLNTRGSQFTTPGIGLTQAPASGGLQGGLAVLFNNPSYATIFKAFSLSRLFSAIGSTVTDTLFFVPGTSDVKAVTRGFGVVFSDVDLPDGGDDPSPKQGGKRASTLIEFFGARGELLFSSFAPASPGDGNLSFFGIVFDDARIASVRITTGATPGLDDSPKRDVVMMDDFIYGEPQRLP